MTLDGCVGVCGAVVQELFGGCHGGFSSSGLRGSEGTEGYQERAVDRSSMIKQGPDDLLELLDGLWLQWWRGVHRFRLLDFDPTLWGVVFAGGMLRVVRLEVLETVENGGDVTGHGDPGCPCKVITVNGETAVEFSGPVGCDWVEGGEGLLKVESIFLVLACYSKVIYY